MLKSLGYVRINFAGKMHEQPFAFVHLAFFTLILLLASPMSVKAGLGEEYAKFLKCRPEDTYSCLDNCVVPTEKPDIRLCGTLKCLRDCVELSSGECPMAGQRACQMIKNSMYALQYDCDVDCEKRMNDD
eukprot:gnl/MRDRNA2_/MRDRNA2_132168_c0_seq1.p1 gnl/MRDRNA2_/MRDRNA2_132168_c0~~gnl/MRDRNA2_/MRDRNA2_132168_c0_seq1.p1  ORF type:complete len:130 (-),score=18.45 gnl/MRDRNA2_/MRDRNA2_132168_c0_seq1:114-503(-)